MSAMWSEMVFPEAPLEDQIRVVTTLERLNHLWAMHGINALAALYGTPHGRTQTVKMDNAEVDRIISGIRGFITGLPDDWMSSWTRAGDEWDQRTIDAVASGKTITAAGHGLIAAMCHHVAEMVIYSLGEVPGRREAALRCSASYQRVAPHFDPPAERIEVPFDDHVLPGYLRLASGHGRAPCLVITGGANSVKEEIHPVSDFFLARGISTVCFDAPGQGEYVATTGEALRAKSYSRAVSAVIDWLGERENVDSDRIALCGRATTGLLAIRTAAVEKRIRAVIAHPASYDWAPYFERRFPFYPSQLELFTILGARTIAEGIDLVRSELTLGDLLGEVDVPILAVNSLEDRVIPASEAELIKQRGRDVDVVLLPGRAHGGPASIAHPIESDWLVDRFEVAAPPPGG